MGNRLIRPVHASELADALGIVLTGTDRLFDRVVPLHAAGECTLSFSNHGIDSSFPTEAVVIAPAGSDIDRTVIESDQPRLAFAKALRWLKSQPGFVSAQLLADIHPQARISPTAVIGNGVAIGRGTSVGNFAVIGDDVRIGEDCVIKSGAVIGEDGFGFERDKDGTPIRLEHLGSVLIGDRVEVGSLSTVCRGTLADTIIEEDVKIDDHVHVAHNCTLRRGAIVTACAEISGSVEVGEYVWIGPNASLIQKVKVGTRAFVGIGATLMRSVYADETIAGYPAKGLPRKNGESR